MRALVVLIAAAASLAAASIPSGSQLEIRLLTALNTANARPNQHFDGVLIAAVVTGEQIAIPAGATVTGHIKEVATATKPDEQAKLDLVFDQISFAGRNTPLAAKLVSIDNARESVDADGKIVGIVASETGSGRMDQGIGKVAQKYPALGDLLNTVKQAVVKTADPNIDYEPGVELTIELTKPLEWTEASRGLMLQAIEPEERLFRLVNGQPFRTFAERPPRPSDVTNLMFLGSEEDLVKAFEKAGWSTAEQLNGKSKLETFRAIVELR